MPTKNTKRDADPERNGVAFVVPVYDKAFCLPAVLAAIRAQQGDFAREYVFVDDGSRDDSVELLRRLTAGWENVTIVEQANHGAAHATNRGIEHVRMPFIKLVDADDLLTRPATARLHHALLQHPGAVLAYGGRALFDDPHAVDLAGPSTPGRITRLARPLEIMLKGSLFNPSQILVRADAARSVGGCDELLRFAQDYSLGLRLAAQGDFLALDEVVTWWPAEVPGRVSTAENRQLQRINQVLAHHLADHPELPRGLRRYACRRAAGRAWHFARRHLGASWLSPWFWRHLATRLPFGPASAAFARHCCTVFDGKEVLQHRLRLPAAPPPQASAVPKPSGPDARR